MRCRKVIPFAGALLALLTACGPGEKDDARPAATAAGSGVLSTVGSIHIDAADLDHQIREIHGGRADEATRAQALGELEERARLAQAALDAGLLDDPAVRSEIGRILASRFKDAELGPRLREIADAEIPETRLRELYEANLSAYRSNEKRQAAVLWLNPGKDPERRKQYVAKLAAAREWLFQNDDIATDPARGFGTLGVDHSEHQASRYNNGVVGWLEQGERADEWTAALADIVFSLPGPGDVSEVLDRPEGVFLVRHMATRPAVTRSFETVADELARAEKQRLRDAAETEFHTAIGEKYPARRPRT